MAAAVGVVESIMARLRLTHVPVLLLAACLLSAFGIILLGEVNRWHQFVDPLLILALALNFVALGVSRIRGVISAVALQGILLGILALLGSPGCRAPGHPAGRS